MTPDSTTRAPTHATAVEEPRPRPLRRIQLAEGMSRAVTNTARITGMVTILM